MLSFLFIIDMSGILIIIHSMNHIISTYIERTADIIPAEPIHYMFIGFKKQNTALIADVLLKLENQYDMNHDVAIFNNAINELYDDLKHSYAVFIDTYKKFLSEATNEYNNETEIKTMIMIASHFIGESVYVKTRYK